MALDAIYLIQSRSASHARPNTPACSTACNATIGTSINGCPALLILSIPSAWPLTNGATKGSCLTTCVVNFDPVPTGTATTIARDWPRPTVADLPFQTCGVTTAWLASNN